MSIFALVLTPSSRLSAFLSLNVREEKKSEKKQNVAVAHMFRQCTGTYQKHIWLYGLYGTAAKGGRMLFVAIVYYSISRSPRWTSGSPRMLLALVREFESRRGEILNLFAKKKKKDELLRAPSVGKHNSTRGDEGRKS